ncbi:unnamed protein product [Cuscuta epithymum]|uniref:Mediator of RNA polymerase II transcription subunit 27 n=2 Tax=Cuscuta epithymum TaxID=186058 RepID=A0AAV0G3V1_9ASTE|nr:unnamed protein product [Cuscuta epithymum]CAH9142253.1 unnamed protein product [Cuscuta epithymum]
MQQAAVTAAAPSVSPPPPESNGSAADAPPKQVAMALERLGKAGRLIADIRLGADRLLEALFVAAQLQHSSKPASLILDEEASMRQHFQDLRAIGRQLEDSGVLNDALRSRSNSWGLHMPLVCPDGAVVAYAWKRQLAGQAGASAVDRTRLALKAFTDQKRRFFPHLDNGCDEGSPIKKNCYPTASDQYDISNLRTVSDILTHLEKAIPNMKAFTYQRLDWLKRASSLPSPAHQSSVESLKNHNFHIRNNLRSGSNDNAAREKITVIELFIPSVLRAIVSVHPAGSVDPDAVAFFSPDEGGSYVHSRGVSVHEVYRLITEHAGVALQHFTGVNEETALCSLLLWIYNYQSLFRKVCSKCSRLLLMDKQSAVLLPPVKRSFTNTSAVKILSKTSLPEDRNVDSNQAFHISCYSEEA